MTKTTVREYDAEGNLTRETITEQDDPRPVYACQCGWSHYCPAHGYWRTSPTIWTYPQTITVTSGTNSYSVTGANA